MKTIKENLTKFILPTFLGLFFFTSTRVFSQSVCIAQQLEHDFPSGIAILGCDAYIQTLGANSATSNIYIIHPSESNKVFKLSVEESGSGIKQEITPMLVNGSWISNASVTEGDIIFIEPVNEGKAVIAYSTDAQDCFTSNTGKTFEVVARLDLKSDAHTAFLNEAFTGDLSLNDANIQNTNYSTPTLLSSPAGSTPSLTINTDGTYTFSSNVKGRYVYDIEICRGKCCTSSTLTVNVLQKYTLPKVIANADFNTTLKNAAVTLSRNTNNDQCASSTKCSLGNANIEYIANPKNGNLALVNGSFVYTPNTGFVGIDSMMYKVCNTGVNASCDSALQIIYIIDSTAINTTLAADDNMTVIQDSVASGNVLSNDSDAQGDTQSVVAKSEILKGCSLMVTTDGNFTFVPATGFVGTVTFGYTVCDDNALDPRCSNATIQFLVMPTLKLNIRAYLEGALMLTGNSSSPTDGRPLMRDNLRVSPFNGKRYIPLKDPYQYPVKVNSNFIYDLSATPNLINRYKEVACGTYSKFGIVPDSSIFLVNGQDALVDWMFVELRDKNDNKHIIATRSGLLQRDGDIVDLDGISPLAFPDVEADTYYITLKHRNHLGTMTKNSITPEVYTTLVNFTNPNLLTYDRGIVGENDFRGLGQKYNVRSGYYSLWAGDFNSDGILKSAGKNDDLNSLISDIIFVPENIELGLNYDYVYGYYPSDYNLNSKAKFDNPNDDKNMLYGQVLFYPINRYLLDNFDSAIEQLP